jgi:hypothetical protein
VIRHLISHEGVDDDSPKHAHKDPEIMEPQASRLIFAVDPALRLVSPVVQIHESTYPCASTDVDVVIQSDAEDGHSVYKNPGEDDPAIEDLVADAPTSHHSEPSV